MACRDITFKKSYDGKEFRIIFDKNLLNQLRLKVYEESQEASAIDLLDFIEEMLNKG